MPTEKRVPSLIVNTLTQAQYEALENPSDTEMWVTPYDESILPDQTGQSGKFLTTDGTDPSWAGLPDISGKANVSLNNLTSAGKKVIAHNALPSTASASWTDLTLGASQATYTMPDDGIVCFNTAGGTVGGYILIGSGNYVNIAYASQTWLILRVWLFVPKGEQFTVHYSNAGTLQAFGYYKLVGNN